MLEQETIQNKVNECLANIRRDYTIIDEMAVNGTIYKPGDFILFNSKYYKLIKILSIHTNSLILTCDMNLVVQITPIFFPHCGDFSKISTSTLLQGLESNSRLKAIEGLVNELDKHPCLQ